ncbi:MAG: hypothetical protein F6J86_44985, partial [Symploca sp. SIO1B1]|nr:hypothetical protein [Symploca sp. SIO1B1]
FNESQILEYTCHWCTAVRLARNESDAEARREGENDGKTIVDGFQDHPYIRDLARNPLMLSAICLVNYFEGGRLPEDRALLYQLCVEGLLHNWDQRRGIYSEFSLDEKLRTCREVALAMQSQDLAEWDAEQVLEIFTQVLDDAERAAKLLEHIRYRTGLLLERRSNVFGFAHLTFQEYLAARAIHEGNRLEIKPTQLVQEHDDGRWKEVIALYSGLAITPAVRDLIEQLITQSDTKSLGEVLTEAYFSAGFELAQDKELRQRVLERVAIAPVSWEAETLNRFPIEEVVPIAKALVGTIQSSILMSESYFWLLNHPELVEVTSLFKRLQAWQSMTPTQVTELIVLLHKCAPDEMLIEIAKIPNLYHSVESILGDEKIYHSQAETALIGLTFRDLTQSSSEGLKASLRLIIPILLNTNSLYGEILLEFPDFTQKKISEISISSWNLDDKQEFASLARQLADHLKTVELIEEPIEVREASIAALSDWADLLEG